MIVYLSELDTYNIAWEACSRTTYARSKGIVNTRRDGKRSDYQIDREGTTGEFAVASLLNLPNNVDQRGPDSGYDFIYNGKTIDVKTTRAKYLLFKSINHFKADYAVLAKYITEDMVDIVGITDKQNFNLHSEIRDFGFGEGYALDPKYLAPIEKFINEQH